MKKTSLIFSLIVIILLVSACNPRQATPLRTINLNLTYIPNVQFAPFYVGIEKGFFSEAGIDVKIVYGNEADMIALIGAGKETFMIASGEQVLMARGQGLPVRSVANWYSDYPVGVASLKSANIKQASDLVGKEIGLPGLFGASYIGFEALARVANLSDSDYSLKSIGFTQVESLITEQVDAVVIYIANEAVQLKTRGYDIDVLKVSDALDLVGNCLVSNEKSIAEEPELIKAMALAVTKSVRYVAENPEESFEICKKHIDNLTDLSPEELDIQRQVMLSSIAIWQLEPLEHSVQKQKWQNMHDLLLELGLLSAAVDVEGAFSDAFDR